uniref:Ycf34 n=1 Tax=Akkesiphycus lubricus TaxID=3022 RepID=A0A8F0F6Q1_AKKLU|nr:hypothetical protein [Akkesiphycus lubricus]
MCICLNCERMGSCEIYSIIEKKHDENRKHTGDLFFPQSPVLLCINFLSQKEKYLLEWDVNECLSYQEKPGKWLSLNSEIPELPSYLTFDLLFNK